MRAALAAAVFVFSAHGAFALDAASESAALAMLHAAAADAQAHASDRYAFTVEHWSDNGERQFSMKLRYDPRLPEAGRWSMIGAVDKDDQKAAESALKQFKEGGDAGNYLLYDTLADALEGAVLKSDTASEAVFALPVADEDLPPDAVEVLVTLDKATGHVVKTTVHSIKPFKPAAVAKVNALRQDTTYVALGDGGPPVISVSESEVEGKAMFKSFKSRSRQVYTDVERIDPPAE
ncbi:MAG: hypothetical protein R3C58_12400 [Parvularculaceae bacterium]